MHILRVRWIGAEAQPTTDLEQVHAAVAVVSGEFLDQFGRALLVELGSASQLLHGQRLVGRKQQGFDQPFEVTARLLFLAQLLLVVILAGLLPQQRLDRGTILELGVLVIGVRNVRVITILVG